MSKESRQELEKAVDELNEKICVPPIKKKDEKKMKKKILIASKLIEKGDNISKETMDTIKVLENKSKKEKVSKEEKIEKEIISKPKKEKKINYQGTKKLGVGVFIVEHLKNGKFSKLSNEQIVEKVMQKFPEAKTKASNISGYRKTAGV